MEDRLPIQTCELVNADCTGVMGHIGHFNGDKNLVVDMIESRGKQHGCMFGRLYALTWWVTLSPATITINFETP